MSRRPFFLSGEPVPPGVDVVPQMDSGKPLAWMDRRWQEVVWEETESNSSSPSTMVVESPVPGLSASDDLLAEVRTGRWLDEQVFAPLEYAVEGIVPEG